MTPALNFSLPELLSMPDRSAYAQQMLFPDGLDYGWVALDGRGSVGFFTNGGRGPIPAAVIAERPAADEAEDLVLQLPEHGGGTAVVETPSVPDAFTVFARRGLFVYDWQDVHRVSREATGCYELVARPSAELTAAELPSDLARLARLTRLEAIVFEEATMIPLEQYIPVTRPRD
jgi:hypothetical protein